MTTRVLHTRLDPALAFTGHHRKGEDVGQAVADLKALTWEAFANVNTTLSTGFVIVTLYATSPRSDGAYRPRLPWMVAAPIQPILSALYEARLITADVALVCRREWVEDADSEHIEVELRGVQASEVAA